MASIKMKQVDSKKLYRISLLLLLFNFATIANESSLTVKYQHQGKQHSVKGEKTDFGYRFNVNATKKLDLATLNWPPYISEDMCNKGWVFQFAVSLLVSKGYQVNIHFYPWARSVKLVEQGKMDILFPEYFIESTAPSDTLPDKKRSQLLALSNMFPGGELVLMQAKDSRFSLKADLSNLKGKIIGVVRGYQNTPEFDAMMDKGLFSAVNAVDELQLMKLLAAKRVDFIVGDPKVFNFRVNYSNLSDEDKQALLNNVKQVQPALQYNHLYFALSYKHPQWQTLLTEINSAISEFEQSGEIDKLIKQGGSCVS